MAAGFRTLYGIGKWVLDKLCELSIYNSPFTYRDPNGEEIHRIDTGIDGFFDTTGAIGVVGLTNQGSRNFERKGNVTVWKAAEVHFILQPSNTTVNEVCPQQMLRIILFMDFATNGTLPQVSDIIEQRTSGSSFATVAWSPYNWDYPIPGL